jgi:hypothetical protein
VAHYRATAWTREELRQLGLRELALARNTIFARAHQPFVKTWLKTYFAAQPWYSPAVAADLGLLSDVDRQNAKLIGEVEGGFTRAELLSRKERVLAQFKAQGDAPSDELQLEALLLARALGEDAGSWEGMEWLAEAEHYLLGETRTPLDDPRMLDRQLKVADLSNMSRRDLRILRNMVFARHGREFKSPILQMYFDNMSWYKADAAYTEARLTELDRRNIQVIQSVEQSIGGPLTEGQHQDEYGPDGGWFWGA